MRTLLAVFLTLAVATAPAWAQSATDRTLIVPGSGIGQARLGMPVSEVLGLAGPPQSAYSPYQKNTATPAMTAYRMYYWFTDQGARTAWTDRTGRVVMLGVFSDPHFSTPRGMHVGSTVDEVEQALGTPSRVSRDAGNLELAYAPTGIIFFLRGSPARVVGIVVVEPGTQGP